MEQTVTDNYSSHTKLYPRNQLLGYFFRKNEFYFVNIHPGNQGGSARAGSKFL